MKSKSINLGAEYLQRATIELEEWKLATIRLIIGNQEFDSQETAKYLGVRFDRKFIWNYLVYQKTVQMETREIQSYHFLPRDSKLRLRNTVKFYKTCILSVTIYVSVVWAQTAKVNTKMFPTRNFKTHCECYVIYMQSLNQRGSKGGHSRNTSAIAKQDFTS